MEYLNTEVDPVLAPIIKQLLKERPSGLAEVLKVLSRLATEAREANFPMAPDDVTVDFLSVVFGQQVTSFEVDTSKMALGVLANAFRVHKITYAGSVEGDKPVSGGPHEITDYV
jgi:hypothetical protein